MEHADIVIVGTGHGGAQAAVALRQKHFEGSICLVGDETHPPYERPPLSKDFLSGDKEFERILIRPEKFWAEKDIQLKLGQAVTKVDAGAHKITFADGSTMGYGQLIWSTGGAPRKLTLEGADMAGVYYVRNRRDVDPIMAALGSTQNVAVIGGGYIGLEAAATMRKLGKHVVLLEALDRVLARVAGAEVSGFYQDEHRSQGVDLRTDVRIDSFVGRDGKVTGVQLEDGEIVPADMIIVGIGIIPAVQPLLDAGAAGDIGVDVDAGCRTTLPDVFAIGDCAAHSNAYADGQMIRLESVQNANDQATLVAKIITGEDVKYDALPWFWSDQYDLKLQTAGLSIGYDQTVLRGHPAERSFSVIYLKDGKVIALDCINAMKDYAQGRKLVMQRAKAPAEKLADADTPLKEML